MTTILLYSIFYKFFSYIEIYIGKAYELRWIQVEYCNLSLFEPGATLSRENAMPILMSVLVLVFMLAFGKPATADDVFISISGTQLTYDDQTAVTQTSALAGSIFGTGAPSPGPCFIAQAGSANCFTQDLNLPGSGSLDSGSGGANANVNGGSTTLNENTSSSTQAFKTTFAAAAAFARAGADMSVSGVLTGDQPVVELEGITLFGGTDPLGTLFALEITNQTPSLGSKLLNNDIRSLSLLGLSAKSILGTPAGWTESDPSKIFYKLVVTLLPDGTLGVSDGGLLGSGHVTAADFFSGCGSFDGTFFSPGDCARGVQTQWNLRDKKFTLPPLPDPQAFTTDIVTLEVARPVPEPSTLLLLGSSLLGVAGWRLRSRAQ